jgi:hypothetical protein
VREPARGRQRHHLGVPKRHDMHIPHPPARAPHASHDSRATTPTVRKRSPRCLTPLRARGSKSWTMARGRPHA